MIVPLNRYVWAVWTDVKAVDCSLGCRDKGPEGCRLLHVAHVIASIMTSFVWDMAPEQDQSFDPTAPDLHTHAHTQPLIYTWSSDFQHSVYVYIIVTDENDGYFF